MFWRTPRLPRRVLLPLAGVASVLTVSAVALAHGGDAGTIHACVVKDTKNLRVIAPDDTCKSNETALDWNIQGTPGPQGPQGAQGPQGEQGPPGATGLSGYEVQTVTLVVPPFVFTSAVAPCAGKKVLGGGFGTIFMFHKWRVLESHPTSNGDGWMVNVKNDDDSQILVDVYAICAVA